MTAENFNRTLRSFQKRRPFQSFRVRFVDGEYIDVDHPEALINRGGTAVYVDTAGTPTLFDHDSVSEVIGETGRRTA
jgi:hypothetical protein